MQVIKKGGLTGRSVATLGLQLLWTGTACPL